MIRWERYEGDITKRFGMKHLIPQITQYLQETGKVIWFGEHSTLRLVIRFISYPDERLLELLGLEVDPIGARDTQLIRSRYFL